MQPKKLNMKLIGGIIAIIVVVVIITLVVLLFLGEGTTDSRFVVEWEQTDDYMTFD